MWKFTWNLILIIYIDIKTLFVRHMFWIREAEEKISQMKSNQCKITFGLRVLVP